MTEQGARETEERVPTQESSATPQKFRKKPLVIEAIQWTGDNAAALLDFAHYRVAVDLHEGRRVFEVPTREGEMRGEVGDWLIRGVKGEFYPCKPDIFEATYEPVSGTQP